MTKKTKRNIIIASIAIALVAILIIFNKPKNTVAYTTENVTRGTLKQTVDTTGNVESTEDIELNFLGSGKIASLLVKKGDKVKSGEALAYLENSKVRSQVTEAEARLDQAMADYDRLISGTSSQEIAIYENTIDRRREDLSSSEKNLASLLETEETDLYNLKQNMIITIHNESSDIKNALNQIEDILDDNDAKKTLSAKNSSYLIKVQSNYNLSKDLYDDLVSEEQFLNGGASNENVFRITSIATQTLEKTFETVLDMLDVLNASIPSANFSQTDIDTYETSVKAHQTTISASKTSLQTAKSTWENKIAYYSDQKITAQNNISQAKNILQISISELNLKKIPPRDFEIASAKAQIKQANSGLQLALAQLSDYKISAPVDGTITETYYQKGEQTSLGQPVIKMIGESKLQIEIDIPESDIAKLQLGQTVEITFDAFGEDDIFEGSLIAIDPAETVIQDVVYYQAKIQITTPTDDIKPGMTANVIICTNKKDDTLYVPSRAVDTRDDKKIVKILNDDQTVTEKEVTTGLKGDLGIEIISGLEVDEKVITFTKKD